MWHEVVISDNKLVERWIEVMRWMDFNYHSLDFAKVRSWMARTTGETWYYDDGQLEIAIRLYFVPKRRRYQLANVGFRGQAMPADVLEIVISKALECAQRRGFSTS